MTAGELDRPIARIAGVGPRHAERLRRLGIERERDLLFHLPLRYEDRSRLLPIGELRAGESVAFAGVVEHAETRSGRRRRLVCRLADGTGAVELVFFHFHAGLSRSLRRGARLQAFGEIRHGPVVSQVIHPEWQLITAEARPQAPGLIPVYPTTEGLPQATLRRLVAGALKRADALTDHLPSALLETVGLPALGESLNAIHSPPPGTDIHALGEARHPAVRRLVFEELLAHRLSLLRLRARHREVSPAPTLARGDDLQQRFVRGLGFRPTDAQRRVAGEIGADLATPVPMLRLLQGDVGSGKTVVAALAALTAVASGWQAAVMAPTELLAEQHQRTFRRWLEPLGVEVVWFSGRLGARARRAALARLEAPAICVAVGTHALFQETVRLPRLGLAVIDEQHRFGVHQRLSLRDKGMDSGVQPHQLVMTATPIPRTLAMAGYADLDVSVIDELPPGREPVTTVAVPQARRDEVVERIREACLAGRQVYWVCTLIEASDALEAQAAAETAERLAEALPEVRVGLVHGRLGGKEKDAAMAAFEARGIDLLVATTVIEVGVDVPNASLMIIENPERLGLAQLHQLRGRVGRGAVKASCVLLYRGPLSDSAHARLAVLRESQDGFRIAERDLEIRGPGELLGTRQTGTFGYRIADLQRDADLLGEVQRHAAALLSEKPAAAAALTQRWVGEGERYAEA